MRKQIFISVLTLLASTTFAQNNEPLNNTNQMPQQMAFYNSNPVISNKNTSQLNVDENNNPQEQQQQLAIQSFQSNQNIEPSAENGFHIRFQIAAPMASEAVTKASSTHIHRGKKNNFFSELYFKNKVKHRLPKRKITYNTALCSRF